MAHKKRGAERHADGDEIVLSLTWDEWIVKVFGAVFPAHPAECAECCRAFGRAKKPPPHVRPVQDDSTPHPSFCQQLGYHVGEAESHHSRESTDELLQHPHQMMALHTR